MTGWLLNAWYMAAWADEVTRVPMARTLLGTPTLLYRKQDGDGVVALGDICPHRFAPLHKGKLHGDVIECPYHGLGFSPQGKCVGAPFKGTPGALRTPAYPVGEQDGIVWIWPGDASQAAATPLPEHPELRGGPGEAVGAGGYLHVASDYRLVADNLLDLSHAEFLHPFLGNPGSVSRTRFTAREEHGRVTAASFLPSEPVTGLVRMMWDAGEPPETIDMALDLHWRAPADMTLDLRVTRAGDPDGPAFTSRQPHIVTPETAESCHYFFGNTRNMKIHVEALTAGMAASMKAVFEHEDVPMIEAQQRYRGLAEAKGMQMGMLQLDEAVVRANRLLDRRIADEQSARAA